MCDIKYTNELLWFTPITAIPPPPNNFKGSDNLMS